MLEITCIWKIDYYRLHCQL